MNSAIAIFFASLISGALSLADFRPVASNIVQILTGLEVTPQKTGNETKKCSPDTHRSHPENQANCACRATLTASGKRAVLPVPYP